MGWTIAQVAGALGARPGAGLDPVARVAGVSIDSRTIRPGELFIAIHGPRHDGHDHVPAAMDRGAIAAVGADAQLCRLPSEGGERCISAGDTFEALKQLSHPVRETLGRQISRVTGSVGQTTPQ